MALFNISGSARCFCVALLGLGVATQLTPAAQGKEACVRQVMLKPHADTGVAPANGLPCYAFFRVDNPEDANFNQLLGINDGNVIVGYDGDGNILPNKGYVAIALDHFAPENPAGATQTQVFGITNGLIPTTVGFYQDANGNQFGFVNHAGNFTQVRNPLTGTFQGAEVNQLLGVDNSGLAAGFYNDNNGNSHGYVYNIAQQSFTPVVLLPSMFPNLVSFMATSINDNGPAVVGLWIDKGGVMRGFAGFLNDPTSFSSINPPTGMKGAALAGINNEFIMVGFAVDAMGVNHGLIRNGGSGNVFLMNAPGSSPNTTPAIDNIAGTLFNGINNHGHIVGFFSDGTVLHGSLAQFLTGIFP